MSEPADSAPLGAARLRDTAERIAAALPPLLVEAERVAMSLTPGVHGRRRAGTGESFWQYRRYGEGDPASAIDWRQSARTDHLYVRENEWESAHNVLFWCDTSPSMAFRSDTAPCSKGERASVLLLALASLLVRGGERVGPLEGQVRPSGGETALRRLANLLTSETGTALSDIPAPDRLPRFSRIVLISDFLMDPALVNQRLGALGGHGVRGHLLQVLDPAEETLPFTGRALFEDVEGTDTFLAGRVEALRPDYTARVEAHREALHEAARRWDWTFASHTTDRAPAEPLLALYDVIAGARGPVHA